MTKQKKTDAPRLWLMAVLALVFLLLGGLIGGGVVWNFNSTMVAAPPSSESVFGTTSPTLGPVPTSVPSLPPTPIPGLVSITTSPTPELIPTPTPSTEVTSLGEALSRGLVNIEIRGRGVISGDSIILTVKRAVARKITISIPVGTLLLNSIEGEPNMVVRRLQGQLVKGDQLQPVETIQLPDDEWKEYALEAYSLDFHKGKVSSSATFLAVDPLPSEVFLVLEAADEIPGASAEVIQISIWAITDGISQADLIDTGYTPDLELLESVFHAANLDPERKRLFSKTACESAEGCITRGNDYYQMGEYAQAIAEYTEAIALQSDNTEALYRRGFAFVQRQDFDRAIDDFTSVTKIEPDNPFGYFALGITYNSKPDPGYDQAIINLTKAIELNQDFVDAFHARGLAYAAKGEIDQAISDFTEAIKLDPQFADAYYARGTLYASRQDFTRAIDDLDTALDKNPEFAEALRARGLSYSDMGEQELAIQDLQRYLVLRPEATDRPEIEELLHVLRGNLPTPAPGQAVSLVDALNQGWVRGEIRGLGVCAGDSIRLTVQRMIDQEMVIVVLPGTLLSSNVPTESSMVARRLRGLVLSDTQLQPAEVIRLTDDQPHEYFIEAYCLEFHKADPSQSSTFSLGGSVDPEVLRVLEAIDTVPLVAGDIVTIQSAIWVITDDVSQSDLATSGSDPNPQVLRAVFQAAGLDPQCKRIFGATPCTATPSLAIVSQPTPPPVFTRTPRPVPTEASQEDALLQPTATLPPTPSICPNPEAQITYPQMDATVSGNLEVHGTANIPNFHFYKVQFRPDNRAEWGELFKGTQPVIDGELMTWVTRTVPPGEYWLRLIVEDPTGNYPEPCEVRVIVAR